MFGEVNGWERPNWYARDGVKPEYEYSYGRQNWFPCADHEAKQLMTNCAFFDQSSFAKYSVEGRDALQGAEPRLGGQCRRGAGPHRLHPVAATSAAASRRT